MKKNQKNKQKDKSKNKEKFYNIGLKILCELILVSVLISLIIHIVHSIQNKIPFFDLQWSVGEMLGFLGSMILGAVAIYQNKKMQNVNDRLLSIEENKSRPGIAIFNISEEKKALLIQKKTEMIVGDSNDIMDSISRRNYGIELKDNDTFWFELKNVKDIDIVDIIPCTLKITSLDKEDNVLDDKEIRLSVISNNFSLVAKDSLCLILGLKQAWKFEKENNIFTFLQLIFNFNLICVDGKTYKQEIKIMVIRNKGNPLILTQEPFFAEETPERELKALKIE